METRQHTISELGKQIENLRKAHTKQTYEQSQRSDGIINNLRSELDARFKGLETSFDVRMGSLEATLLKCFASGSAPQQHHESST
ncbi:hypothetical protein Bca4012_058425 [Brassica carinata]